MATSPARSCSYRHLAKRYASLALPIFLSNASAVGFAGMDALLLRHLGGSTLTAVSLANSLYLVLVQLFAGITVALAALVAAAKAQKRLVKMHHAVLHTLVLNLLLAAGVCLLIPPLAHWLFARLPDAHLRQQAGHYLTIVTLSLLPSAVNMTLGRYLNGCGRTRATCYSSLFLLLGKLLFSWWWIPKLGMLGAAWASVATRLLLSGYLICFIWRTGAPYWPRFHGRCRLRPRYFAKMLRLGLPISLQLGLDNSYFLVLTLLVGHVGAYSQAAHAVMRDLFALCFSLPATLAVSSSILSAQAWGQQHLKALRRIGWLSYLSGSLVWLLLVGLWVCLGGKVLHGYALTPAAYHIALTIAFALLVVYLFDALTRIGNGLLTGTQDTLLPTLWTIGGNWGIGLPLAYGLGITTHHGACGIWWGMALGYLTTFLGTGWRCWRRFR